MTLAEAFDYLKEWAIRYVKHRDIAVKNIAEIRSASFGFLIVNNDGTSTNCLVQPSLTAFNPAAAEIETRAMIITLSNDGNIQAVYNVWDRLAAKKDLLMVFVNPFSATEEKWVLKPYLHNKVCDRSSLLQGLRAMAELVEPANEETMVLKIKAAVKSELGNVK